MEAVQLREGGLLLRPWRLEDADGLAGAMQDPLIARWGGSFPTPYTRSDAVEHIERATRDWAEGTAAALAVVDPATGELLGSAGLSQLNHRLGQAEITYWTAAGARGRRIAVDAVRAVVRFAHDRLGLHRIGWRAEVGNHASRLVAARAGFRFEGIRRAELPSGQGWRDAWAGCLLPGELREATEDDAALARVAARSRVFGGGQPTLQTSTVGGAQVRLRPLRVEDAAACMAAASDPASVRYTEVPHPYTSDDAQSFITALAPRRWLEGTAGIFAIADADDGYVGSMDLRLVGDELTTDLGDVGYLVGPWARGKGYASAALRAVCDWGFAELDLHRIEWRAYVGNTGSRGVARRAGFTVEGTTRRGLNHRGTYEDAWLGARLRED